MKVRKVSGAWVKSKSNPNKRVFFLNVEGEGTINFKAVYMYVDGKKRLLRVVGRLNNAQIVDVRDIAEKMMKSNRQ